jgi:hypothetical protein
MHGLMLGEHISPVIAIQLRSKRVGMRVVSVHEHKGGTLLSASDDVVLRAAAAEGLTLVTYDLRTIPTLLEEWAEVGMSHAGVLLVDQHTVRPNDFGALVRTLQAFCAKQLERDWTNHSAFLEPPL